MRLLIDTHIYIWWGTKPELLKPEIFERIDNTENQVFVSITTPWEMLIKSQKGKLAFNQQLLRPDLEFNFELLPITFKHTEAYAHLPPIHRDPFDRIMLAQALSEGLTFVTHDRHCLQYGSTNLTIMPA